MKRDWDLIRALLLRLEAQDDGSVLAGSIEGWGAEEVVYHMGMLLESGLVRGSSLHPLALTWEGHELLDEIRSQSTWNAVKKIASKKGLALSFEAVKLSAAQAIKAMF